MNLTKLNDILDTNNIIRGVKTKERPTYRGGSFRKDKPLSEHNFPLSKRTHYKIYGYKKDASGIKRPYWMEKILPTGRKLTPQMCKLDGFFNVTPTKMVM